MKVVLALSVAVLMASVSLAGFRSPILGATQTEREIRWLWKYVNEFVISCSQSPDCQSTEVKQMVEQLKTYLPAYNSAEGQKWQSLLQFVSEKERPDLFRSDSGEAHRVVVTGSEKFSPVYINTDRMEMPHENWVGLLVHEAVHHLGFPDDDRRLPDLVGAAIAKHFKTQAQATSLEQFNLAETRAVTFNSVAGRASVGFLSWGPDTSDLEWGNQPPYQTLCADGEAISRQQVGAVNWKVNFLEVKKGIVKVRGGGVIQLECRNAVTGQKRSGILPLDASIDLQYSKPLAMNDWRNQKPQPIHESVSFGPSPSPNDHLFGAAQTFLIKSTEHGVLEIGAGETLTSKFVLQSVDNFQPAACNLTIVGTEYSYILQDHFPGVNFYRSCTVKSLGNRQWEVEGQIDFPATTRPDYFYVPVIVLADASGMSQRSAIPTFPELIKLSNVKALPAAKIEKIEFPGLKPAKMVGINNVTDSYLAPVGQNFTLEFDVMGTQEVGDMWLDIVLWYPLPHLPGELGVAVGSGSTDAIKQFGILAKEEYIRKADRTRVILTFKMPAQIQGIENVGYKFSKIYMRTSDFSWVEIDIPGKYNSMVINPKWGQ